MILMFIGGIVTVLIGSIGLSIAAILKKTTKKWFLAICWGFASIFISFAISIIESNSGITAFIYLLRLIGVAMLAIGLIKLFSVVLQRKPKRKWALLTCAGAVLLIVAFAGLNTASNASHRHQDAVSSEAAEADDDDADTNDDDSDDNTADSASSDSSSTDSSSSSADSSKSEQASSKAASKSMALDSFKKSLQARVQNDSVHLSSYQLNGGSEVTYTATAETAAFDRATLQAYADHLFDNTQQLAAMCDISIPVFIVLQAPNGNFLARTKLDGTVKVYPQ